MSTKLDYFCHNSLHLPLRVAPSELGTFPRQTATQQNHTGRIARLFDVFLMAHRFTSLNLFKTYIKFYFQTLYKKANAFILRIFAICFSTEQVSKRQNKSECYAVAGFGLPAWATHLVFIRSLRSVYKQNIICKLSNFEFNSFQVFKMQPG